MQSTLLLEKTTCFPAQKSCMEMAIIKHSTGTIISSEPWIRQRISARTGPGRSPLFSGTWEGDSVQQSPCIQDWLLTRIRTDHQHLQHQQIWLSWTFASSLLPDYQGKVQEWRSWRIQTSSVQHPILLQKHGPSMTHVDPSRPRVCSVCSLSRFRIRRWWWEHGRSQRRPGLNQLDPAGSKGMCGNLETCHSTAYFAQFNNFPTWLNLSTCFSTLRLAGIIRHPCMGSIAGAEALTLATRVSMRDLQNCYTHLHDSVVEARHNQPHSLKHRFSRHFQRRWFAQNHQQLFTCPAITRRDATNGVPVDHLNEARCRLVARLIEARGLDGAAKDQSPHGDLEGRVEMLKYVTRCSIVGLLQTCNNYQ